MSGPHEGEKESEASRTPPGLERILTNDLDSLVAATTALEELLARHAVSGETVCSCLLALEEIVTNIVKYAYTDAGVHEIRFAARLTEEHVVLNFSDDGRAFDPLAAPPPDLEQELEERPIGGLGIHLVRQLAARLDYERTGGRNELTAYFALQSTTD